MESDILLDTYAEVQRCFAHVDDLAHGWEHVERVYKLAVDIAEQERADHFVVGMAALMHDLGRASQDHGTKHHAELSVLAATEILAAYHVPSEKQEAILHAIDAHSYSRNIEPRTLEARIVRDADRLDALGAIGIVRWAMTRGSHHTSQTKTYHPDDPFAEQRVPDDRSYMLDHFFIKLLKLGSTMTTETGRTMAKSRSDFMHAYLDKLRAELGEGMA